MGDGDREYPDLDDAFLRELEAKTPPAPPRKPSILENLSGWAFFTFVHNTELFSESFIRNLSRFGRRKLDSYCDRMRIISQATVDAFRIASGEPPSYSDISPDRRIRRACGFFPAHKYHNAVCHMNMVCRIRANDAEREAMQLGLPIDSAIGLSAFFYLPAFYWALVKSLFTR